MLPSRPRATRSVVAGRRRRPFAGRPKAPQRAERRCLRTRVARPSHCYGDQRTGAHVSYELYKRDSREVLSRGRDTGLDVYSGWAKGWSKEHLEPLPSSLLPGTLPRWLQMVVSWPRRARAWYTSHERWLFWHGSPASVRAVEEISNATPRRVPWRLRVAPSRRPGPAEHTAEARRPGPADHTADAPQRD